MRTATRTKESSAGRTPQTAPPRGRQVAGVGRVCFWNGGSLWIGQAGGRGTLHAHHAIQISLALEDSLLLRADEKSPWTEYSGAIVPPDCRHQFDGCDTAIAQIFVEPETVQGRALLARFDSGAIEPLPPAPRTAMAALLRARYSRTATDASLIAVAQRALALLVEFAPPGAAVDARITRVIAHLQARSGASVRLSDAAAAAHLSPSRFRHLFIEQTGTAFRAYVLWQRLNVAIEAAMNGKSWTDAAHAAGFVDSAHLTRTFRRMFGIAPAMLVVDKDPRGE